MKTELISSWNLVATKNGEMYVVYTVTGAIVWINKSKFDTNAEQISYRTMKIGDTYTKKDGTTGVLTANRNEFLGAGKQIVKKFNSIELLDHLAGKGITPTFALN